MKKILTVLLIFMGLAGCAFADSIHDSKGGVINGKIDGISDGIIQIKKDGNIITFIRPKPSPVYKDSILVRKRLISFQKIKYSGYIIFADSGFVRILCEDNQITVPRYKVSNMELFIP